MPIPRTPRKPAAKRAPRAKRTPTDIRNLVDGPDEAPATEPKPVPEDPIAQAQETLGDIGLGTDKKPPRAGSLESRLAEVFASSALLPAMTGDTYSAFIIGTRSSKFAHDLAELAKVNPRIKRILESMLDGGAYGGVFFSGAALLLPILWSYGILPAPPIDPFAAFYTQLPPGVVPRSARKTSESTPRSGRPGGTPSAGGAPSARGSAPGPAATSPSPHPGDGPPPGVVTVPRGAHPPVNAAAAQ